MCTINPNGANPCAPSCLEILELLLVLGDSDVEVARAVHLQYSHLTTAARCRYTEIRSRLCFLHKSKRGCRSVWFVASSSFSFLRQCVRFKKTFFGSSCGSEFSADSGSRSKSNFLFKHFLQALVQEFSTVLLSAPVIDRHHTHERRIVWYNLFSLCTNFRAN